MDDAKIAQLWANALSSPDEATIAALGSVMSDGIIVASPLGTTEGKQAALANFGQSPLAPLFAQTLWSAPELDGSTVTIGCTFPSQAPVGGVTVILTIEDGEIVRSDTTILPAPPPAETAVHLTDTIAETLAAALANRTPVMVAYVDAEGRPQLSYRGTTQVLAEDQLGLWARNPEGGIVNALPNNPNLTLFYRDPATRTNYQFHGRARVTESQSIRDRVFDGSPEPERNFDPQRRGVAIVVDVDSVDGRDANGAIRMRRSEVG
jgi:hypothetical protein